MIKRILAIAVSAGLLAWLLADGRWRGIGEVFRRLDGLTLGLAFAGFLASYLLRALRVFDDLFDSDAARALASELRWAAELLGGPRDAEVMREHLASRLDALDPSADVDAARLHIEATLAADHVRHAAIEEDRPGGALGAPARRQLRPGRRERQHRRG